jgi:hypothetical protein
MKRLLASILCLAALAALAPAAALATYDDVGSGSTRIALDKGFVSLMQRNGVKLSVRAPATLKKGVVTFPAVRGKFDPITGPATIEHDGALILRGGKGFVSFKALQVKTTRRSAPLAAKVAGGQLKLGSGKGSFARFGFGMKYTVRGLRLAPKVAARLDKRLHLEVPVGAKTVLGSTTSGVEPEAVSVLGQGRVSLDLDPGFLAKLDQLHVAVNPVFPAERPGPFTFTIFGGRLAPDLGQGAMDMRGGLELLQLGGGQVTWTDPRLDFGAGSFQPEADIEPAPPYAGKVGPVAVAALGLAAGAVTADPRQRTVALRAGSLSLGEATAATLNEVFAKPQGKDGVFVAGEPFGQLSFAAQGQ